MSTDKNQDQDFEYVSAAMDDDLSEEALARLLEDADAQQKWYEYHLIRDYLQHAKPVVGKDIKPVSKEAFTASLADVAAENKNTAQTSGQKSDNGQKQPKKKNRKRVAERLAAQEAEKNAEENKTEYTVTTINNRRSQRLWYKKTQNRYIKATSCSIVSVYPNFVPTDIDKNVAMAHHKRIQSH